MTNPWPLTTPTSHYRGPYSRIEDYELEVSITLWFRGGALVGRELGGCWDIYIDSEARITRKRKRKISWKRYGLDFIVVPLLFQARPDSASPVNLSAANQRRNKKGAACDNTQDWEQSELDIEQLPNSPHHKEESDRNPESLQF